MSLSRPQGGEVHHCASPSYKEYLIAVENGCEYIQYPSDNRKGFTKTKISESWDNRLASLRAYQGAYDDLYEAWGLDGIPSIANIFCEAHRLLHEQIVYFKKHDKI